MKVISAPAIMFKGSGWYVTDYSDKLKAPDQLESAQKSANGQGDQKPSTSPSSEAGTVGSSEATEAGSVNNSSSAGSTSSPTSPSSSSSSSPPSSKS